MPQNNDWNLDSDVGVTDEITASPVLSANAIPGKTERHVDPTIPTLVLPKPDEMQKAALPRRDNQPYVLNDAEKSALDALNLNAVFREMKARNPAYRGVVATPKVIAEFQYLRERYDKLCQVPRFQPTDAELVEIRHAQGLAITKSERNRAERLLQLKTALEHNAFLPVIPDGDLPDVLLEFICEERIVSKIVELRRAQAAYQVLVLESFIYHSPSVRKQEQKIALQSNPSDDTVNRITQEIMLMGSEHFRMLASNKVAQLNGVWNETVKPLLVDLLQTAELYVSEQKLAALANAQDLCRANDVDEDHAALFAKKYDAVLRELKHRLSYAVNPGGGIARPAIGIHAPPVECALQHLFRIPVLPEAIDLEPQAAQ
jgi:hypothetical protein